LSYLSGFYLCSVICLLFSNYVSHFLFYTVQTLFSSSHYGVSLHSPLYSSITQLSFLPLYFSLLLDTPSTHLSSWSLHSHLRLSTYCAVPTSSSACTLLPCAHFTRTWILPACLFYILVLFLFVLHKFAYAGACLLAFLLCCLTFHHLILFSVFSLDCSCTILPSGNLFCLWLSCPHNMALAVMVVCIVLLVSLVLMHAFLGSWVCALLASAYLTYRIYRVRAHACNSILLLCAWHVSCAASRACLCSFAISCHPCPCH